MTYDAEYQVSEITTDISNITLSVVSKSCGHILKSLKTSNGNSHDFIIDTGSVFSIIQKSELMLFYPSAILNPTHNILKGNTSHSLDLVGQYKIPVIDFDSCQLFAD